MSSATMVEGTIVVIDIDRFEEKTRMLGLDPYRPNRFTALLTNLVEELAVSWRAIVVYGLDRERGTEEAVIEIPLTKPEEVEDDLVRVAREMCEARAPVTIVAIEGLVGPGKPVDRRLAYSGSPDRARARRILEKLKRRGGGAVYVNGRIVWKCRGSE
ncbi:hypothetical protein APE_1864.1 [Aeropyrum pernix K1]|uniref:Uncharacterized protein n=1 Tax=Aeropyrum pernix (strain ATCC 700893 / DSM 11879 / JCM 9820 / NBRC 100138 / K1) TaxID=272557 RepID=Q9YAS9_AERPE|nr:hypothetical protein [Aeropyrum pernix]BAA80869.2 hypothetical protein APE_1864.1 [Aeropyrum pernix K1]